MDELTGGPAATPFRFRVDGAFTVSNREGVWLSGGYEPGCGPVRVGDRLVLHDPAGPARPVTVVSLGDGRRADDQGRPGVFFAVAVRGIGAAEVRPGMLLASPGAGPEGRRQGRGAPHPRPGAETGGGWRGTGPPAAPGADPGPGPC